MLVKADDTSLSTIVDPQGNVATRPTIQLTDTEAALLRTYKKFLQLHRLQEALFCANCGHASREDGCKSFVQDGQILIECRCKVRLYLGQTF